MALPSTLPHFLPFASKLLSQPGWPSLSQLKHFLCFSPLLPTPWLYWHCLPLLVLLAWQFPLKIKIYQLPNQLIPQIVVQTRPAELALFLRVFLASEGKREADMRGAWHTRLSPSRASGAPRSRRACSCVKNLKTITSVPQAIAMSCLFSQPNHKLVSGFPFPRVSWRKTGRSWRTYSPKSSLRIVIL